MADPILLPDPVDSYTHIEPYEVVASLDLVAGSTRVTGVLGTVPVPPTFVPSEGNFRRTVTIPNVEMVAALGTFESAVKAAVEA